MRELTLIELGFIGGGVETEKHDNSLRSEFWSSFMYSSGFASGIFWSPVMPIIMGAVSTIAFIGNNLMIAISALGYGTAYTATTAYSYMTKSQETK